MPGPDRAAKLQLIERNIRQHGFHLYVVTGGCLPRFAYTIGLRDALGVELILAGAIYYTAEDVKRIMEEVRQQVSAKVAFDLVLRIDGLGSFTLRQAHESWTNALLLGALDFYAAKSVVAYQIVPDDTHWTIDVPNLAVAWSATGEPIWQWLHQQWPYVVSPKSTATTNLDALRGATITEVTRWEDDEWEMFAGPGPDVSYEEARVVALGTLLAADPSLRPALDLEIGVGIWRDSEGGDWNRWASAAKEEPSDPTKRS